MATVYRIQHKNDRTIGPYMVHDRSNRPEVVQRMHNEHATDTEKHPNAWNEFERSANFLEFFGFWSASDLLRWFRGFIPDLLRAGFEIVRLDQVTITAYGEYQVLFTWN